MQDELRIETAEQVTLELPLAGIGSRGLALLLDTLIEVAATLMALLGLGLGLAALATRLRMSATWVIALMVLLVFAMQWGYFSLFEILWRGQTPGKRVMKLRVIRRGGGALTPFEALTRNLVRAVDMMPGFYGVGLVTMICNRQSQRLGDLAAGTVVVHERRQELPAAALAQASPLDHSPDGLRLSAADLELIETFLHRREQLGPGVREQAARQIAQHLASTRQLPARPEAELEAWLESLARQARSAPPR